MHIDEHAALNADCPGWPEADRDRYRAAGYWGDETFAGTLARLAARHGAKTALIEGEIQLSYAELGRRAEMLAGAFAALGLVRGDRAVVQLPNGVAFVETVLALTRLGVVPVLALPSHRRLEIGRFCAFTRAKLFVTADRLNGFDHRALAREVRAEAPDLIHVVIDGAAEEFTPLDSLRTWSGPVPPDAAAAGDVAVFQISGGTTGVPKLIPRRHDEYLYNIATAARASGMDGGTVYLCALPVAHNFPFACPGVMGTLVSGGTAVLAPDPGPETGFALIERHRVTITSLVPPLALLWMQAAPESERDRSSLRTLQVGGAKLASEAARRVRPALGCRLQQVFGMAEGLICYTGLDDDDETVALTQGRPMSPGDEVRVVDEAGNDVPPGEPGQLLTRGPYTIRGYYRIPEHNEVAFTPDGFYRTGDIVRVMEDGSLILSGRDKDQINRGGEKLSPEEVENLLLAHEGVHDAAVVGLPDPELGERICAFVILRDAGLKPLALTRHLRSKGIAAYKIPDQFLFLDRFPETGVGKVSRKVLREMLKQAYQAEPATGTEG
ncbi:2,3-dihydroxybenzoate-AMP ligase (plasmid) [Azospirillum humicireducens]|uniref:3-methylmercaptopropionyl-CoA ligase n=1 Tax=Azospirillum humicireducens TaxID=1226968 RepID=A0A2R4VTW9_9PROT|nr:AMP-binding protein [Azospirillum humicireducens]AWB07831.1 2,3-dihydroxybenzoate-AMP ligase [Azospirillum humicireducens]